MSAAEQILLTMIHGNLEQEVEMMEIGQANMAREHVEMASTQFAELDEVRRQEAARHQPKQLTINV